MGPILTKDEYLKQLEPTRDAEMAPGEECPVCYDPIEAPTYTACRHVFCFECLKQWGTTSHTCPTCRQGLYERPDDGEEDDSRQPLHWPQFDFEYNPDDAATFLGSTADVSVPGSMTTTSLCMTSFVDYHRLLTAAVAFIAFHIWHPNNVENGPSSPELLQGWKSIASAIEGVLSRLRQQSMPGLQLFRIMEQEVHKTLQAPINAALYAGRRSENATLRIQYNWLDACVTAVLRQVVRASYEANPAPETDFQHDLPDIYAAYTAVPFAVNPHDLFAAFQNKRQLSDDMAKLQVDSVNESQAYVSRSLLLPTLLAYMDSCQWHLLEQAHQQSGENLDVPAIAWAVARQAGTRALMQLNGETIVAHRMFDQIRRVMVQAVWEVDQWPSMRLGRPNIEEDSVRFRENRPHVMGRMADAIQAAVLPCVLVAIKLHDETQLRFRESERSSGASVVSDGAEEP